MCKFVPPSFTEFRICFFLCGLSQTGHLALLQACIREPRRWSAIEMESGVWDGRPHGCSSDHLPYQQLCATARTKILCGCCRRAFRLTHSTRHYNRTVIQKTGVGRSTSKGCDGESPRPGYGSAEWPRRTAFDDERRSAAYRVRNGKAYWRFSVNPRA